MPVIGASAAISGTMAAAIRFVFVPGAPLGARLGFGSRADDRAYQQKPLPLLRVLTDRRAVAFLVIWFVANFVFGVASVPLGITSAAVAWEAHVGGFLAGLLLFPLFDPPRQYPDEDSLCFRTGMARSVRAALSTEGSPRSAHAGEASLPLRHPVARKPSVSGSWHSLPAGSAAFAGPRQPLGRRSGWSGTGPAATGESPVLRNACGWDVVTRALYRTVDPKDQPKGRPRRST